MFRASARWRGYPSPLRQRASWPSRLRRPTPPAQVWSSVRCTAPAATPAPRYNADFVELYNPTARRRQPERPVAAVPQRHRQPGAANIAPVRRDPGRLRTSSIQRPARPAPVGSRAARHRTQPRPAIAWRATAGRSCSSTAPPRLVGTGDVAGNAGPGRHGRLRHARDHVRDVADRRRAPARRLAFQRSPRARTRTSTPPTSARCATTPGEPAAASPRRRTSSPARSPRSRAPAPPPRTWATSPPPRAS